MYKQNCREVAQIWRLKSWVSSDHGKQDTSDSKTGSEADTAVGKDSQTNSYVDDCFNEMDRRHANKIAWLIGLYYIIY